MSAELDQTQKLVLAKQIANLACELDYVGTNHLVEPLHDIAMELAGEYVDEVYAPEE